MGKFKGNLGRDIWFTADTHLDHKNILRYCDRPFASIEEMNEIITYNWNSLVKPKDLVYIVGDFAFKRHLHWINVLNGKKILILGNHDKMSKSVYSQFTDVKDVMYVSIDKRTRLFLCHYPMISWRGSARGSWSIHGHTHGRIQEFPHRRRCDIGVDVWDFIPVHIELLKLKMNRKTNGKDIDYIDYSKENARENMELIKEFYGG